MTKVIVLGGGASGFAAAIRAAECGAEVLIIEAQDKPLRKVAASGNGRCNLSNRKVDVSCYCTQTPDLLAGFLDQSALVCEFFERLGLLVRADSEGRLYPITNRARTVVDALCLRAEALGVRFATATVTSMHYLGDQWIVRTQGETYRGDVLIAALGSPASRSLGATDALYELFGKMQHIGLTPFRPSLVPLRTEPRYASLKGSRAFVRLSLHRGKDVVRREEGEVLFAEYGLSGVSVMQLSAFAVPGDVISIDILPDFSLAEVKRLLMDRVYSGTYPTVDRLLLGLVAKPISYALLKEAGLSPLDAPVTPKLSAGVDRLAHLVKDWPFTVTGDIGFESAQVALGGIRLDALDADLQSKSYPYLYFVGEGVDVTGLCGGYNLHWAWLSGLIAGERAASVRK